MSTVEFAYVSPNLAHGGCRCSFAFDGVDEGRREHPLDEPQSEDGENADSYGYAECEPEVPVAESSRRDSRVGLIVQRVIGDNEDHIEDCMEPDVHDQVYPGPLLNEQRMQ